MLPGALAALVVLCGLLTELPYAAVMVVVAMILATTFLFPSSVPVPVDRAMRSGRQGEDAVLAWLRGLDDRHVLFRQLYVPNSRSRTGYTEIDTVVVGPEGIATIEVKNHRGVVLGGKEQSREWTVQYAGKGGRILSNPMRNPVRQARIQSIVLSEYLAGLGLQAPVAPLVVLSHPRVTWASGWCYSVPVLVLRNAPSAQTFFRGKNRLGPRVVRQISEHLSLLPSGSNLPPETKKPPRRSPGGAVLSSSA